jgi:hypothetical protein
MFLESKHPHDSLSPDPNICYIYNILIRHFSYIRCLTYTYIIQRNKTRFIFT